MTEMNPEKTSWVCKIIQDPDDKDQLLLDLGFELCDSIGWKVGDELDWRDGQNGTWMLTKKSSSK